MISKVITVSTGLGDIIIKCPDTKTAKEIAQELQAEFDKMNLNLRVII